jgi:hypothetical protein
VGSPYAITPSAATGGTFAPGNYAITYVNGVMTVNPAALTIQADNASRPPAVSNPPFAATYTGFKLSETPAVLTGTLVFATPAVITSPQGMYAIVPSGQSASNYAITYVNGALTVGQPAPAPIANTIIFEPLVGLQQLGYGDPTRLLQNCVEKTGAASGGAAIASITVVAAGQCSSKSDSQLAVSPNSPNGD